LNTLKPGWEDIPSIAGFCILISLAIFLTACTTSIPGTGTPDLLLGQSQKTGNFTITENQPLQGPVRLTVISADKIQKLNTTSPVPGHIFLVLNISVKNNRIPGGYNLTYHGTTLLDLDGSEFVDSSLNLRESTLKGLVNPVTPPKLIAKNEEITGQIVFSIADSKRYRLNLIDGQNNVLSSQTINFDDLITTHSPVSITIISADKLPKLKNNTHPYLGHIYVILNTTIKNNDVQEGFDFTNNSLTLYDPESGEFEDSSANYFESIQQGLENPIIPPKRIAHNETVAGQIVFAITDSKSYRLNLIDGQKNVLSSHLIRFDNLITPPNPLNITINSVEKRSLVNPAKGGGPMPGHIFVVLNITIKNNDLPGGFNFVEESILLQDLKSGYKFPSFNGKPGVLEKLENPVRLPKIIAQNSSVTGNILFATTDSDSYGLAMVYSNNTEMWSKIIHVE